MKNVAWRLCTFGGTGSFAVACRRLPSLRSSCKDVACSLQHDAFPSVRSSATQTLVLVNATVAPVRTLSATHGSSSFLQHLSTYRCSQISSVCPARSTCAFVFLLPDRCELEPPAPWRHAASLLKKTVNSEVLAKINLSKF